MARIFGFEIKRSAPRLAAIGSNFAARSLLASQAAAVIPPQHAKASFIKAVGAGGAVWGQTLPTQQPRRFDGEGLSRRAVQSDPLGDWYLNLPDKIPPKQISSILRMALAGNIWQQSQLTRLMADSWPVFNKCQFELRAAIASAKYIVHPYSTPGQEASASAKAKADLVQRALAGFEVDRFADEDSMNGMIYDLCDAILNGVSVEEMIWNEDAVAPDGQPETLVRAAAWVHPRNLAFTPDGRIGVAYAAESGNMSFSNQVRNDLMDNPDKFLVARFKSKSGSCLGAGWMRKLVGMWVMVVYGRDFALNFAQKYGNPFFDLAYDSGITDAGEIDKFESLAKQAANNGYFVHPNNSQLVIGPTHSMGADNPQMQLMNFADAQCREMMLGQNLTSTVGDSGSRALGDVHNDVRTERIEEHGKWIARILTEQFAVSVLRVNYGKAYAKNPEKPTVELDMTRQLTALEQADYMQKLSNSRVPVVAEEVYKKAGMQQPEPGDKVLVSGDIIILEEPMTPTDKQQKDFDTQLDQQLSVNQLMGGEGQGGPPPGEVEGALAAATPAELLELENLVSAAERAPHQNGELVKVRSKVNELVARKRI